MLETLGLLIVTLYTYDFKCFEQRWQEKMVYVKCVRSVVDALESCQLLALSGDNTSLCNLLTQITILPLQSLINILVFNPQIFSPWNFYLVLNAIIVKSLIFLIAYFYLGFSYYPLQLCMAVCINPRLSKPTLNMVQFFTNQIREMSTEYTLN